MVKSTDVLESIQNSLSLEDKKFLDQIFVESYDPIRRRSRKALISELNNLIVESAILNNRPSILSGLVEIPGSEIDE